MGDRNPCIAFLFQDIFLRLSMADEFSRGKLFLSPFHIFPMVERISPIFCVILQKKSNAMDVGFVGVRLRF